ncbi:hypothetical protein IFR04_006021 [Cadophora malorum]|uniref:Uncharacterized protein n=1 Tax=Cadophora malorum TaxID=108018 RepID=A0A8H7WBF6_9HELO|nr:hypothetical protein IFR04_006021 [Cadophora malorum]
MRGKQSVCLFCRHTAQTRSQFKSPRRHASSPSAEPLVLPRLIIDLDAADSTFVRKVDGAPAPEEPQRSLLPIRRLEALKEHGKWAASHNARPNAALRTLQVSPIDIWAYGLLGINEFTPHQSSQDLRHITRRKAVHHMDSADSLVKEILNGFATDPSTNLRRAGFCRENEDAILKQMLEKTSFSRLRRMIPLLSSTTDGGRFLVKNGAYILDAIRVNRKMQNQTQYSESIPSSAVMELLNNLHINLESKGLPLGPDLCNGALYYASKTCNIAAVKKYLQLARRYQYAPDWRARKALRSLLLGLAKGEWGLRDGDRRREAIELITGWRGGLTPRGGEARSICFAYLSYKDTGKDIIHAIYPAYILGLGELGLHRAVHAEAFAGDPKRMNPILIGDEHKRFRAQMFAIAFLLAEDEQHALQVLESVPLEHKDITLSEDTKTMRNWRPKSSPVSRKEVVPTPNSSNVWLLSLLYNHYDFHHCIPTPTLKKHLAETIVQLPHDPSLALEALKNLLLLDTDFTRHPAGSGRKTARFITWGEVNGKGCIRFDTRKKWHQAEKELGEPTI